MPAARSPIGSTILALLAVLSICLLSSWHAASFHDDDAAATVTIAGHHVHAADPKNDPDSVIHFAAHSISQGIAVPAMAAELVPFALTVFIWTAAIAHFRSGLTPPSLLRPPRG